MAERSPAFMRGQGPVSKALVRGLHRSLDIRLASLRIARDDEAVAGAVALQRAAVAGVDELAIDEQLVGLGAADASTGILMFRGFMRDPWADGGVQQSSQLASS